ncbi:MAG: GDSL-type esterase/lipase family protein [Planctomycetaceae bacterium]|nr:GDSL-type esterase/lipase family protein [Planctomycetaceae bacterium]
MLRLLVAFGYVLLGFFLSVAFAAEFRFEKDILKMEERDKQSPPKEGCTMFAGSSSWALWGKQLEEDFREFDAINRGFGGSKIHEVIHVTDRIITPYKPSRILFFCGTNDIASGMKPEEVFADFKTFLERVRKVRPQVKIYFMSLSHAPAREKHWPDGDKLNSLVRELAKQDDLLFYIDTVVPIEECVKNGGNPWFDDRLHLSREGQEVWIKAIRKTLSQEKKSSEK